MATRYLRYLKEGSSETFWKRLITVLLCEAALFFVFVQYTYSRQEVPALVSRDNIQEAWYHGQIAAKSNMVWNPRSVASPGVPVTMALRAITVSQYNKTVTSSNNSVYQTLNNSLTSNHNSGHQIVTDIKSGLPPCPLIPPGLSGKISADVKDYNDTELALRLPEVTFGGVYRPASCTARHKVAVIVPFRNRARHLKILLNNLHPLLQKQQLEYGIFVTELDPTVKFNKAVSMNIAFLEVSKKYGYNCFIFHDVDLIPENDNNMYTCPENPRHMSVAIDKFGYELPYVSLFGGVTAMRKEVFEAVNGYSNRFFDWGGEDDDMYARIRTVGLAVTRYTSDVSAYRMLPHNKSKLNEERHDLLKMSVHRWKNDGLSNIKYEVLQTVHLPLYTHILATINQTDTPYQTWERKHAFAKPIRIIDRKIEEQLEATAKEILKTDHLDSRLYYMILVEFIMTRNSTVTTEGVSTILTKILPRFTLSQEVIKKFNEMKKKRQHKYPDFTMNKYKKIFSKNKFDSFSKMKMSLTINNFHESMKKMHQITLERQGPVFKLKRSSNKTNLDTSNRT